MSDIDVEITDHVEKQILEKAIEQLAGLEVDVGFFAGEATEENGVDVAAVAMFNEFGTCNMPARPFMRNSVDNHQSELESFLESELKDVVEGKDASSAFKRIGIFQKDKVQEEIQSGSYAPNAPATVRKKGSAHPLVDTGRMLQSVNYKVKKNGG